VTAASVLDRRLAQAPLQERPHRHGSTHDATTYGVGPLFWWFPR